MQTWGLEGLERVSDVSLDRAATFSEVMASEGSHVRRLAEARSKNPAYIRSLAEAAKLIDATLKGDSWAGLKFQEAMSTSDFPNLFTDILDRQVLARFREWLPNWQTVAKKRTVRDFRAAKLFLTNTGATQELDAVAQLAEYPERAVAEQTPQTFSVSKYGARMALSWETLVNDDLDMFRDFPDRLATAARRTEEYTVARLYVDASGPHASLYTVGNKNVVNTTNSGAAGAGESFGVNPPLSIDALQQALLVLARMVDEDGEPILIDTVTLVVPPALEVAAQNIMNATQLFIGTVGQGANAAPAREQRMQVANWMTRKFKVSVNPYIPRIATTANGNSSWFLFANPNDSREALSLIFLRGHEEPETFMRSPNAQRVGGGMADVMGGDFDTDSIMWKIRHVLGTMRTTGGHRMTVASNGSGS